MAKGKGDGDEDVAGLGPEVPNPEQLADRCEFAAALSRARERAGKPVRVIAKEVGQPSATIGGYFSGQHLPPLRQTDLFREILRRVGITDDVEIGRWVQALERVRQKPGPRPGGAPRPYRGLESFGPDDAQWFFGREDLIDGLVGTLSGRINGPADAIIVVVGPSGVGKSSLLRAGLVPAALSGRLVAGRPWRCVLLTPGKHPMGALGDELAEQTGLDTDRLELGLREGTLDWSAVVGDCPGLMVVVDQFEEVFTDCSDEAERQAFIAALFRASRRADFEPGAVAVALGLRSDFYDRAAQEPLLLPVLQDSQVLVGPMNVEQLRQAIIEPAHISGLAVDEDLVDLLLDECVPQGPRSGISDPGALPLLSHALLETWERAHRGRLTVANYRATGGIAGAVPQTAERLYNELTAGEQTLARRMFLRLLHVGDDVVVTRRRIRRIELPGAGSGGDRQEDQNRSLAAAGGVAEAESVDRVLDRFVAYRLLTVHADTVEISHEALVRAWPRLSDWVDEDRDGLRVRRQLSEATNMWAEGGRDPDVLLRGARLEAALNWASTLDHHGDLNELERSFLQASEDQDRDDRQAVRCRTRRLQALVAVVSTLAVVASVLATVAIHARNLAIQARNEALSRQVAIEASRLRGSDPRLAMQLALAAYRIAPTLDATSALLDSSSLPTVTRLLGQPGATALAIAKDGQIMAVSRSIDGTVQLVSLNNGRSPTKLGLLKPPTSGHQLFALAFSPNGATLATGGTENDVRLWDVADPRHPRLVGQPLDGLRGAVESVGFSPDGHTLIAGGAADTILRWNVTDPAKPTVLLPLTGVTGTTTQAVTFSPNGRAVAAGGTDGILRVWDTSGTETQPAAELQIGDTVVNAVSYSPDGRILAAGSRDKTVRLWDVTQATSPTLLAPALTGFTSWVNTVAFSPDGRTLAAGSSDNMVKFWTVEGWKPLPTTLTHPQPITAIAFTPDSHDLVTAAEDGATRLWPLPGPVISGPTDTIFSLSYNSTMLAVGPNHGDTSIELWDTSNRQHPNMLGAVEVPSGIGAINGTAAISPNGRFLAAATTKGNVQLFDIADPASPVALGSPLTGPTPQIEQVAFSASTNLLAAGSDDGTIWLWDVTDPGHPKHISTVTGPHNQVLGISFDPHSHLLAAASADKTIRLWDLDIPDHASPLATLTGFDNYAYSVAFNPDGHILAAGSADKTLRLWEITDPRHPKLLGKPITGPNDYVYSVAFNPNGHTMAAAVTDGTVWEWDVSDPVRPKPTATLTAAAGPVFVVAFSPDGANLAAAGGGKTVYLWYSDVQQAASNVCSVNDDPITAQEWAQYIPNQSYKPPCGTRLQQASR